MAKILLVQPLVKLIQPGRYVRNCSVEPLGLEYVAAALQQDKHDVHMAHPIHNAHEFESIVKEYGPDLIGYSVYTYAYQDCITWASIAKRLNNKIINVLGGYHPSACPEIINSPAVDYVICGEGEQSLRMLVSKVYSNKPIDDVPGLAYLNDDKMKVIPQQRITCLDCLPYPARNSCILNDAKCYQLSYPSLSEQTSVAQILYSRGCPYSCDFCSNENMWDKKVYWRDPGKVAEEICLVHKEYGTNLFFFADLTFNLDTNRVHILCDELQKINIPVFWWAMCRADLLNESLLIHMKEAGCTKVTFGLETPDNAFQKNVKGVKQCSYEEIAQNIFASWSIGLLTRATLMIGYPEVRMSYYGNFLEKLSELYLDEIRVSFYTPFPGTKLYIKAKKNQLLMTDDLSRYTADEPIIKNLYFDSKQLINYRMFFVENFYLNNKYIERVAKKIHKYPKLEKSFIDFFDFLKLNNITCSSSLSEKNKERIKSL